MLDSEIRLAIYLVTLVVCVYGRCDTQDMIICVQPFSQYSQTGAGVFRAVDSEEWNAICNTFEGVDSCVGNAINTCPTQVKNIWGGVKDSFDYLCSSEGKTMIQKYNPCYENPALQRAATACNTTFQMETGRLKSGSYYSQEQLNNDICRVTNNFLGCVIESVENSCNADTAAWNAMVVKKALQPTMDFIDCTLGCGSAQVSLVLLLASLLMFLSSRE